MVKTTIWSWIFKKAPLLLGSSIFAVWVLSLTTHPALANEPDPSFTLKIEGSRVELTAAGVPLNTILDSISQQSGLKLRATDQATELIYCHLINETLVETLKKLLRNWNFAFIYKGGTTNEATLDTLWITNRNSRISTTDPGQFVANIDDQALPQQDHMKSFEKDTLAKVFADPKKVLTSFSAKNNVIEDQSKGVQISKLAPDTPLITLGLEEEDLVVDVNGQSVTTAAELVQALKTATKSALPIIRIDRRRKGMVDPIYIETH